MTIARSDYPLWITDVVRYGDTDKQGHVNNAVFSTFLETGRVNFLLSKERPLLGDNSMFAIARLTLDFKTEMHWPGKADIGTRVKAIGRSSITIEQVIFQGDTCTAISESVVVQMDVTTRKSKPLSDATIATLKTLQGAG